jgi:hypothetical protein
MDWAVSNNSPRSVQQPLATAAASRHVQHSAASRNSLVIEQSATIWTISNNNKAQQLNNQQQQPSITATAPLAASDSSLVINSKERWDIGDRIPVLPNEAQALNDQQQQPLIQCNSLLQQQPTATVRSQQPLISATASCNSNSDSATVRLQQPLAAIGSFQMIEWSATIERSATTVLNQCNCLLLQQPLVTVIKKATNVIVEVRQS